MVRSEIFPSLLLILFGENFDLLSILFSLYPKDSNQDFYEKYFNKIQDDTKNIINDSFELILKESIATLDKNKNIDNNNFFELTLISRKLLSAH